MKAEPLDVYLVWLDRQELPDLVVRAFDEVEYLMVECHAGRDHPMQAHGNHVHHSDHSFAWAPPFEYADSGPPMAPVPQMLSWNCVNWLSESDLEAIAHGPNPVWVPEQGQDGEPLMRLDISEEDARKYEEAAVAADFASCPCRFERPLMPDRSGPMVAS